MTATVELLDYNEVARQLRRSRRWVEEQVRAGAIRHYRINGRVLFAPEHVTEFLQACERPVTARPRGRKPRF